MTEKATVKILRFDPSADKEPWYATYEVPYEGWYDLKVTDTLRYIYENLDAGLSFREDCNQRLCGVCLMMVNKKRVLACDVLSEKEMVIEPAANRRVLKDLITDMSTEK